MKLNKKKELASKTLGVGKARIVFNTARLDEIKEAITKQDIRDLHADGAIIVKEIIGSKRKFKRKTRRRAGSIKKTLGNRKKNYMIITRKLRGFIAGLRRQNAITEENYWKLRKEIKAHIFRSKAHIKERIKSL